MGFDPAKRRGGGVGPTLRRAAVAAELSDPMESAAPVPQHREQRQATAAPALRQPARTALGGALPMARAAAAEMAASKRQGYGCLLGGGGYVGQA
jgi:hypothetical protein